MQTLSPQAQRVAEASAVTLARAGYDIVWAEFLPGPRILRLYIEHRAEGAPDAPGASASGVPGPAASITLEDCVKVSRLVSDLIDTESLMGDAEPEARYSLEVSSPGLDRPLVTPGHFQRFVGRRIAVRAARRLEGIATRRFEAKLLEADASGIQIALPEGQKRIAYHELEKAQLVPEL